MGQGSCQRCGPGVRADVRPGASLSLPRVEIPGCMPFPLTQELASATHRHLYPDPSLNPIWPGDSCDILAPITTLSKVVEGPT